MKTRKKAKQAWAVKEVREPPTLDQKLEGFLDLTLPTDSRVRKDYPLVSGCLNYFPAALAGVSHVSKLGNDKHNPGQPLHHSRGKSSDHADCVMRHLMDVQDLLSGWKGHTGLPLPESVKNAYVEKLMLEVNQLAWRALAFSQELHENFGVSPIAPAARFSK